MSLTNPSDLLRRLRENRIAKSLRLYDEAADEIERLRAALQSIVTRSADLTAPLHAADIARAALGGVASEPECALPESLRDPVKVLERGREILAKHEAITRSAMYEFLGWLSGDIPELHAVEVPRLADSWERYRAKIDEMPAEKSAVAGPSTYTALNYIGKGPLPDCDECHRPYSAHGEMHECPSQKSKCEHPIEALLHHGFVSGKPDDYRCSLCDAIINLPGFDQSEWLKARNALRTNVRHNVTGEE